jgi:hypothetical protein
LGACAVAGCGYGRASQGLCRSHYERWRRAGSPELSAWLASVASTDAADRPTCRVASCSLWAQPCSPLCRGHHARWHYHGSPTSRRSSPPARPPGRRSSTFAL